MFYKSANYLIVVEEDLDISVDFFRYDVKLLMVCMQLRI